MYRQWIGGDHSMSYFLLPLPDSLELVLEPDPELELSPSLELSELLLSLSRDTWPSAPNKQHTPWTADIILTHTTSLFHIYS